MRVIFRDAIWFTKATSLSTNCSCLRLFCLPYGYRNAAVPSKHDLLQRHMIWRNQEKSALSLRSQTLNSKFVSTKTVTLNAHNKLLSL